MKLERKALYNFLRMECRRHSSLQVKPWQIEDLREKDFDFLFNGLTNLGVPMDRTLFLAWCEKCDTPEELADFLSYEEDLQDQETGDRIFLLVFELWRRLAPEKPSLSLFCDELDHLIWLYDEGHTRHAEAIQDAVANLRNILEESADQGTAPKAIMDSIESHCANDLESFLYDYICDQVDNGQTDYALELLDSFDPYITDSKWFTFLRARILSITDPIQSDEIMKELIQEARKTPNLEFCFDLLEHLAGQGDPHLFVVLAKAMLPLLEMEEDLQDYLAICLNYYARLDLDPQAQSIQQLLSKRRGLILGIPIDPLDATLPQVASILENA